MEKIRLKVTTLSNLFIGGVPSVFEIGGVDLCTVMDYAGNPFIPASSLKGALRNVVRDMKIESESQIASELQAKPESQIKQIGDIYRTYLTEIQSENEKSNLRLEDDRIVRMNKNNKERIETASAEYLFGITGFNHTPKLLFNDLLLEEIPGNQNPFSIDSKTSIVCVAEKGEITSNPRIYQTIRPGVTFCGEIGFYQIEKLGCSDIVKALVENAFEQFNDGVYRLGNSGSRGYGRVRIEILQECDQDDKR